MTKQQSIPGTDPVEPHPEIRTRLDSWLRARDDERDAKDRSKRHHDELLDAITAAGIPYYTYDADGKRRRVFATVGDPKLKTTTVASLEPKRGRRGRDKDVALPIDKEREKAVSLLSDTPGIMSAIDDVLAEFGDSIESVTVTSGGHRETVKHRKVPRKDVVSDEDPFARVRGLVDGTGGAA